MRFIVGGEAQEMDVSVRSLFQASTIAVLGIYFILILLFNSPIQPFTVMSSIPFGIMLATPITPGMMPCLDLVGDDVKRLFRRSEKAA